VSRTPANYHDRRYYGSVAGRYQGDDGGVVKVGLMEGELLSWHTFAVWGGDGVWP
jgi:hypothetical protein